MSRLDDFIARMQAQRACIDEAARLIQDLGGPVLEFGLGNGRTYDHLRKRFPQRAIYVFDREVAAHPDCVPDPQYLRLGDFRSSVQAFAQELKVPAVFVHADVGSSDRQASMRLAGDLAPIWRELLAPGALLACDQPLRLEGLERQPLPAGTVAETYHFYRRTC
jgi:trans-aconitate methyltransferase